MNKVLFLLITLALFLGLMFATDYISVTYLLSDSYVPRNNYNEEEMQEYLGNTMSLDEFREKTAAGEEIDIESPEEMPIEIQMAQFYSYLLRIFIFVMTLILSFFAAFIIKEKTIDFTVMALNSDERGINMARIALYVTVIMATYLSAQKYPFTYPLGWVSTVLWALVFLATMIWILNIVYAFKKRRQMGGRALKPARK